MTQLPREKGSSPHNNLSPDCIDHRDDATTTASDASCPVCTPLIERGREKAKAAAFLQREFGS